MNGAIHRSRKGIAAAAAATGTKPTAKAVGNGRKVFANPGRGDRSRGHWARRELRRCSPTRHPPFFRRCRGSGDVLARSPIACAMGWDLPPLPRLRAVPLFNNDTSRDAFSTLVQFKTAVQAKFPVRCVVHSIPNVGEPIEFAIDIREFFDDERPSICWWPRFVAV